MVLVQMTSLLISQDISLEVWHIVPVISFLPWLGLHRVPYALYTEHGHLHSSPTNVSDLAPAMTSGPNVHQSTPTSS